MVLYVKILQAIYGCIESSLLWYKLFTGTLDQMGYKLNAYYKCVVSKVINGKQCTITWYADDNKLLHVNSDVVTKDMNNIAENFGELVISRGNKHDLLEIHIKMDRNEEKIF